MSTPLERRDETIIHLLDSMKPTEALCGEEDPVRVISVLEALDPNGRHFTCGACLRAYQNTDRFGGDE